jgi:hypothetical protein
VNNADLSGLTVPVLLACATTNQEGWRPTDARPYLEELARRAQQNDTDRATLMKLGAENLELRLLIEETRGQLDAVRRVVRDHDFAGTA